MRTFLFLGSLFSPLLLQGTTVIPIIEKWFLTTEWVPCFHFIWPPYKAANLTTFLPTNLPTYQPTNLPTYQPTNLQTRVDLDIYLSSKQSYPTNHCANWQAYHPTNQPAYQSTDLPWTHRFHGNNGPFPKQFYSFPGSNYQYTQETCLDVKETCQEVKERCQEVK